MLKAHLLRIMKNRLSLLFIIYIIVLPSLEIPLIYYFHINAGGNPPMPYCAFILAGYSVFQIPQKLLEWFLPIYLLVIVADNAATDYRVGYFNVMTVKCGKKRYFLDKLRTSFLVSFGVVLISLFTNLLLVNIVFRGGTEEIMSIDPAWPDFTNLCLQNPILTDILYSVWFSFMAGLCGMLGAALTFFFKNRKLSYIASFGLWMILVAQKKSLALVWQPYTEYPLTTLLVISAIFIILYIGMTAMIALYELLLKSGKDIV